MRYRGFAEKRPTASGVGQITKKGVEGVVQIFDYGVCMLNGSTAAACVFVALIAS